MRFDKLFVGLVVCLLVAIAALSVAYAEPEFEIESPENQTFNTTSVQVSLSANQTLDRLGFEIGNFTGECENCSAYAQLLTLEEGDYILMAHAVLGNQSSNKTVSFRVELDEPEPEFEIVSPSGNYSDGHILLNVTSNMTFDKIEYRLDGDSYAIACENCSGFAKYLNVSEGNRTMYVRALIGSESTTKNVHFFVASEPEEVSKDFKLTISAPRAQAYYALVPVIVNSNVTVDSLKVKIAGSDFEVSCSNCSSIRTNADLDYGNYTLTVFGVLGNISKNATIAFEVKQKPYSNYSREYDRGFEKLPKALESGEISDEELASILRSNKLNPGVINRLIKTGKLGSESLDAVLELQSPPPGIYRKLLLFIGMRLESDDYASLVKQYYPLTKSVKQKLVQREDIDDDEREELKEQLRNEEDDEDERNDSKRVFKVGSEHNNGNWIPPGQAKKSKSWKKGRD